MAVPTGVPSNPGDDLFAQKWRRARRDQKNDGDRFRNQSLYDASVGGIENVGEFVRMMSTAWKHRHDDDEEP